MNKLENDVLTIGYSRTAINSAASYRSVARFSLKDNKCECGQSNYRLREPNTAKNNYTFAVDEIMSIVDKKSVYLDTLSIVQFIAGFATIICGGIGLAILALCVFIYYKKCIIIQLKDGKKIKVFYESDEDKKALEQFLNVNIS